MVISSVFLNCDQSIQPISEDELGYDYFPLYIGAYWEYQVDSVIYDPAVGGTDITTYQSLAKEEVVDTFTDNTGEVNYIIYRYYRKDADQPWEIQYVWHASRDKREGIRVENNLRFVKIVFPPVQGAAWDGNIYIDESIDVPIAGEPIQIFKNWGQYRITAIDQSINRSGKTYDPVLTVTQVDDQDRNLIEKRYAIEQYARGVGLIYKEMWILNSQKINDSSSWEVKAEEGFILKQALIDHR